jgi:hypothetical protein
METCSDNAEIRSSVISGARIVLRGAGTLKIQARQAGGIPLSQYIFALNGEWNPSEMQFNVRLPLGIVLHALRDARQRSKRADEM